MGRNTEASCSPAGVYIGSDSRDMLLRLERLRGQFFWTRTSRKPTLLNRKKQQAYTWQNRYQVTSGRWVVRILAGGRQIRKCLKRQGNAFSWKKMKNPIHKTTIQHRNRGSCSPDAGWNQWTNRLPERRMRKYSLILDAPRRNCHFTELAKHQFPQLVVFIKLGKVKQEIYLWKMGKQLLILFLPTKALAKLYWIKADLHKERRKWFLRLEPVLKR